MTCFKSISDAPAPVDVIETLDKNKARDQLKDLLTRVLPVFAADGSDDSLVGTGPSPVSRRLTLFEFLVKEYSKDAYDGIRELFYDALICWARLISTRSISGPW